MNGFESMSPSRPYRSEHRQRQAEQTRAAILRAARSLFTDPGYAATSVADIAAEAGVSVPTVYSSIGTKAQLARNLVEFVNEEGGVMFKVFVGRNEDRSLKEDQLARFEALRERHR